MEMLLLIVGAMAVCGIFLLPDYTLSGWRDLRKQYPAWANIMMGDYVPGETFRWTVVCVKRSRVLFAADFTVAGIFVTVTTGGIMLSRVWSFFRRGVEIPWRAITRAEWQDSWWGGGKVVLTIEGFDGHVSIRWPPARLIYERWMKFKSYFKK